MKKNQICSFCVMDQSDPEIIFLGAKGCNNCHSMLSNLKDNQEIGVSGSENLSKTVDKIKRSRKKYEFDSVLGISGGLDSSYMALKCFDWGLQPLLLHVDTGWNSEVAVRNIQAIIDFTGWKLHTYVLDWNEMRDLHLAYLKSGISNQDVPQDHAIFSVLYKFASKNNVKYIINGGNTATEGIFPRKWHGSSMDARNLIDIHRTFGTTKLTKYPTTSFLKLYFYYPFIKKIKPIRLLNFIRYDRHLAITELETRTEWKSYPQKHGESNFTRFFQEYFLITRFGIDKRRSHLSSNIVTGQISRDKALTILSRLPYEPEALRRDTEYICRKLRISSVEFNLYLNLPKKNSSDFKNWEKYYNLMKFFQLLGERYLKVKIRMYR